MASVGEVYQIAPMSRIPVRKTNGTYSNHNHNGTHSHLDHLSPLEKLRIDYQEKLLLEKEKKMSTMYERRNDEALAKVRKYSGKRNYHDIGYMNGSNGLNSNGFSEMKSFAGNSYSNLYKKRMVVSAAQAKDTQMRRPQKLPPINNMKKSSSHPSIIRQEKIISNSESNHAQRGDGNHTTQVDTVDENNRSSPPPNTQHLRLLRERRLKQRKIAHQATSVLENVADSPGFHAKRKLTDFEKWQREQDNERFERLQQHHAKQGAFNGDFDENIHFDPSDVQNSNSRTRKKVNGNPFTTSTVRSVSPEIRAADKTSAMRKKEILRQAIGKTTRIAELEEEILKKQMALRKIQDRDRTLHSSSSGDSYAERKAFSDQDFQPGSSYAPISKPVRVSSKRSQYDHSSSHTPYDDDEAPLAFQNKPVLVRRDGSQGSSRGSGTPPNPKSHKLKKPSKKTKYPNKNKSATKILNGKQNATHFDSYQTTGYDHMSAYPIDTITEEEQNVVLNLVSCNICGRKFSDVRLEKHRKICSKSQGKTRKVYDMTKARTEGTDAETFVRRRAFKRSQSPVSALLPSTMR